MDFRTVLRGTWKRNSEWREFGSVFQHLRISNTFVHVDFSSSVSSGASRTASAGSGSFRALSPPADSIRHSPAALNAPPHQQDVFYRWSFGSGLGKNDMHLGYEMKISPVPAISRGPSSASTGSSSAGSPDADEQDFLIELVYAGTLCHGRYCAKTRTCVLNLFLPTSTVTTVYRIVNQDTINICTVEVDEKQVPNIQYGLMTRLS